MKMYQVDAFTKELFKGNSAAVIILDEWLDDALMQKIALENNLSETAFIKPNSEHIFDICWYTPESEIDFCGHATLASAFILFEHYPALKEFTFRTRAVGDFYITQHADGRIVMDFPIRAPEPLPDYPQALQDALDLPFKAVYINPQAYIVEYEHADQIRSLKPNFEKLKQISIDAEQLYGKSRDIVVTAPSKGQYDCISRYFAPILGVNEDPVTGSIHTAVVPFWAERLNLNELVAYQASNRGGTLYCKILGPDRIEVSGYAKLYMTADIYI